MPKMIKWEDIDTRLGRLGKDRSWLADNTPYSPDTLRTALAPSSTKRSDRMLTIISKVIEDEDAAQNENREVSPGLFEIFLTPEELDRADRASRLVGASSLVEYCRDVIFAAADQLLEGKNLNQIYPSSRDSSLRVAESDPDPPPDEEDPPLGVKRKRA